MDEVPPLVDQSEIDALFGESFPVPAQNAMQRILLTGVAKSARLPMLDIVIERFAQLVGATFRNRLGVKVEVAVADVSNTRVGQILEDVALPSLFGVFRAGGWDGKGVVVFGPALVQAAVQIALGGRSVDRQMVDKRGFTLIERNIVREFIELTLADLSASFQPLCGVEFQLERLETEPQAVLITSARSTAVCASLTLSAFDVANRLDILLPHAMLEPIDNILRERFAGERLGRDTAWAHHIQEVLRDTEVELVALLGEQSMRLSEVVGLKVGDRLQFQVASDDPVIVMRCEGRDVLSGRLGQRSNQVAVQLDHAAHERAADRADAA